MTNNTTFPYEWCLKTKSIPIAKVVVIIAIFLLGVSGNFVVILLVSKVKKLHKQMCFLIVNTAIADILVLSLGLREWLNRLLSDSTSFKVGGIAGIIGCKANTILQLVAPIVSITTMLIISIERLRAVTCTVRVEPIKRRWFACLVAASWLLPTAIYSYTLYAFDILYHKGAAFCTDVYIDRQGWVLYHFVFYAFMVVMFTVLVVLNLVIIWKLRSAQQTIHLPEKERKKRELKFARAVQMVSTCCVLFFICWGPRSCLKFLDHLLLFRFSYCRGPELYFSIEVLFFAYFVFTPAVYFLFLSDFRDAFKELKGRKLSVSVSYYISGRKTSKNPSTLKENIDVQDNY